jgi:phospholipase/carboxylesterase
MSEKLSGPMLAPNSGAPEQLVVLLHGYGSDGQDLISLAPHLSDILPNALFVAPNAPNPCDMSPSGYQWFPLDLDRDISRLEGAENARPILGAFLSDLWQETGLSAKDTLLVGFSQGAMVSLDVGLRLEEKLLGIISFSGGVIAPQNIADELKSRPPVLLIHGSEDGVVPPRMSILGCEALKEAGVNAQIHISPATAHSISPDGLEAARAFTRGAIAGHRSKS